jgi:hypothetical protein
MRQEYLSYVALHDYGDPSLLVVPVAVFYEPLLPMLVYTPSYSQWLYYETVAHIYQTHWMLY